MLPRQYVLSLLSTEYNVMLNSASTIEMVSFPVDDWRMSSLPRPVDAASLSFLEFFD
jgi:hypothetical protein